MPRKQEPTVIAVLDYFETAPLEAAKLALQLAGRALRKREPIKKAERPAKVPQAPPAAATASAAAEGKKRTAQAPPVGQPAAGLAQVGSDGSVPAV